MKKTFAFTLGGTLFAASMSLSAATVDVTNSWFTDYSVNPNRGDPSFATDGDNGQFRSLGLGGTAVFEFSSVVNQFKVWEQTNGSNPANHFEEVRVYATNNWNTDTNSIDLNSWQAFGTITNVGSQSGFIFSLGGADYKYVALLDISPNVNGRDGFDVDNISGSHSSTPSNVPLPAALPLFMSALAGLGFVGFRRRKA